VSGDTVFLGFGETPVVDSGIRLSSGAPYYKCAGLKARLAINMICDTGDTAAGGIDYR